MSNPSLLSDRAVIRLSGEGRRAFLQGVVTQDMDRLTPENAIFSALLTPQGKILADFFVTDAGDDLLIDCDRETAPALVKRLTLYKLRAKVSIDLDESLCILASDDKPSLEGVSVFKDPRHDGLGWRAAIAPGEDVKSKDYEARRIALGVPEFGKDFGPDDMFLLDVNYDALNAVSYKKGCFVGQEVSSRMKRKGAPRRRAVIAEFEGPAPEKGSAITADAATLGALMSGANNLGLAAIRMDRWEKAETEKFPIECGGRPVRLRIPEYLEQG